MKNIIAFYCFLLLTKLAGAQCSFSYSKDICGERDESYSCTQLWNGDFIIGGGGGCGANPELSVLMRLNCKGETIWYRPYPENNAFGIVGPIYQIDSNVAIIGIGDVNARIIKINLNTGDLIQDKYKFIPNNQNNVLRGGSNIMIHKGYLYSTLIYEIPDSNKFYFVIKIDQQSLDIIWLKKVFINNLDSHKNIIPWNLFISGNEQIGVLGYIHNSDSIFMHILDTSANIINTHYPFKNLSSNNFVPSIVFRVSQSTDRKNLLMRLRSNYSSKDFIAKVDTSGSLVEYLEYEDVRFITQTKDGGYAICGRNDLIRKLDSNFQTVYQVKSKWSGSNYFFIGEAKDGGLFASGMAGIFATDGDMAFIKAEPHGGINSTKETQPLHAQITTTPNPATTQVHIESPIQIEKYTLTNTSGTTVQSGVLDASNSIDISQLPPGIYFLQLQLVNGQTVTKKLVRSN